MTLKKSGRRADLRPRIIYKPSIYCNKSWILTMQNDKINIAQQSLIPVSRQAAAEGIVLLENKNKTLPIKEGEKISLFGRCQIDTFRSGTGSGGAVNVPYAINILEGLRANSNITLNEELIAIYEEWIAANPFNDGGGGWAAEPWFQKEMPLNSDVVQQAAKNSDKAVVIIGRTAGEDQDNADAAGSYRLTDTEMAMIEEVNSHFDTVILVFNVTNTMDMSWLQTVKNKQSIHAILYNWAAGMEGGHGLADVLSGDLSPSGRLTDTIAYKLSDYFKELDLEDEDDKGKAAKDLAGNLKVIGDIVTSLYKLRETVKKEIVLTKTTRGAGTEASAFERGDY